MIDFVITYLIINTIILIFILGLTMVMAVNLYKKDKKHEIEKAELQKQKEYYSKELDKRYGLQQESKGYDLGERGNKI